MATILNQQGSSPASSNHPITGQSGAGKVSQKTTKVSIIIPVYNEFFHLSEVLQSVLEARMPPQVEKEVIVVDDGSTDGTTDLLKQWNTSLVKIHHSVLNFGKGTAIRIGLKHATGDIIVIQDGDQEYDPNEIQLLVKPIMEGRASVVYGSRFLGRMEGMYFRYWLCNKLLVWTVRLLFGAWITDEATAYKAFKREVIQNVSLNCRRFEFCPEITAKLLRTGHHIHEVPISYTARSVAQGKKIRLADAFTAFWTLVRYRLPG